MKVVLTEGLFEPSASQASSDVLPRLFRFGSTRQHSVVLGFRRSQATSFHRWLANQPAAVREVAEIALRHGRQSEAREVIDNVVSVEPLAQPEWEGTRVRLPPEVAVEVLSEPLQILVENSKSDGAFLQSVALGWHRDALWELFEKGWVRFLENDEGLSGIKRRIEATPGPLGRTRLRLWVVFDSDALVPERPSRHSLRIDEFCLRAGIKRHRLKRRSKKRLDLLDSIRKGIPIGSILIWRTNLALGGKLPERVVRLGPHALPPPSAAQSSRAYLLDGMQRLSTLYGCLRPLPPGASPFIEDEDGVRQSWLVCYDLERETFEIAQGEPLQATWLPLTALLDSVRLIQFTRGLAQRPDADVLIRRADALAETFRNYKLPIIPVASDSLAEATLTFQRVNSQGTRMSELHMVRALTWSESFDLEVQLEQAQSYLAQAGWETLEPELILKACKAALGLDVLVEVPQELSEGLKKNTGLIKEITNNIWRIAKWLGTLGIRSPRSVPYSAQIVLLAEAARNNPSIESEADIQGRLWRWFWHTTYANYFTGISGYRMQTLLEGVRTLATGGSMQWPNKKEPPLDFELSKRFDARAARVKATAWLLANQKPLSEGKELIDALGQLATRGPAAMVPIIPFESEIPGERGIANRTFMSEGADIRPALLERPYSLAPEVLRSHALSPEAAAALAARDYPRFLQLRKTCIESLERQFFESLPKW